MEEYIVNHLGIRSSPTQTTTGGIWNQNTTNTFTPEMRVWIDYSFLSFLFFGIFLSKDKYQVERSVTQSRTAVRLKSDNNPHLEKHALTSKLKIIKFKNKITQNILCHTEYSIKRNHLITDKTCYQKHIEQNLWSQGGTKVLAQAIKHNIWLKFWENIWTDGKIA